MSSRETARINDVFEKRYADLVRYLRYRLPNAEDARDLAQEAFFRLLRRSQDTLLQNPEAYLFRIASNLAYEQRLKHTTDPLPQDDDLIDPASETEAGAERQQRLERLSRILQALPALPRAALILQRRDGMTYSEIAAELNISTHMVKKHLFVALVRCREGLGEYR